MGSSELVGPDCRPGRAVELRPSSSMTSGTTSPSTRPPGRTEMAAMLERERHAGTDYRATMTTRRTVRREVQSHVTRNAPAPMIGSGRRFRW